MEAEAALREQSRGCGELGSPLYAVLLARLADDLAAGGPTARVLRGHEHDPGPSALALRLLGSVHRLVLERRAGALAAYWPSVGGTWDDADGTAAVLDLLDREPGLVAEWLDRPPQTNEVGRAAALVGALRHLPTAARLPVRLVELGASGGLNLLADRLPLPDGAWEGPTPPPWPGLRFLDPVGCDPHPVDVRTTQGRLTLTAYVWADQTDRLERLRHALDLAQRLPVDVRRATARELLAEVEPREGAVTVVWHSVMWQYLDESERSDVAARIEGLAARASASAPVAHVAMEPRRRRPDGPREMLVTLRCWSGAGDSDSDGAEQVLGVAAPHGVPVVWERESPSP